MRFNGRIASDHPMLKQTPFNTVSWLFQMKHICLYLIQPQWAFLFKVRRPGHIFEYFGNRKPGGGEGILAENKHPSSAERRIAKRGSGDQVRYKDFVQNRFAYITAICRGLCFVTSNYFKCECIVTGFLILLSIIGLMYSHDSNYCFSINSSTLLRKYLVKNDKSKQKISVEK